MACIMLDNLCIVRNDPCEPKWRLKLGLIKDIINWLENKDMSDLNRMTISNCLWNF